MDDSTIHLKKYFDQNQDDLKRFFRLGETDGKNELPKTEDSSLSSVELEILSDAESGWLKYKSFLAEQHNKITSEVEKTKQEIEVDISTTLDKISEDKSQELDLLEAQFGTGTSEYKNLKENFDSSEHEIGELRKLLNRPLDVKFVGTYLPFMIFLAVAEIPVNRLAFELFFEQSPLISLILAAAIGGLFVFFAHIIGGQLKNAQCKELFQDNNKTYATLSALVLMSLLVMYFLGIMREQLVTVQASANLNLEDLLNEDKQSAFESGANSLVIGSKGLMLLLLNAAIYVSGIVMAFMRHDAHPMYEAAQKRFDKSKGAFLKYQKNYEIKQVEMLRDFNQKHSYNKTLQRKREAVIDSILRSQDHLRSSAEISKEKLIDSISARIRNYREGNKKSRKTDVPVYFSKSIYELVEGRIK